MEVLRAESCKEIDMSNKAVEVLDRVEKINRLNKGKTVVELCAGR